MSADGTYTTAIFPSCCQINNVSRAARELYISQPNLSNSISRLEKELGVPLFEHRKGKIELNEYGRIFLATVDRCFSELNTGVHSLRQLYNSNQNMLTLVCNIESLLRNILKKFTPRHPNISIRKLDVIPSQIDEGLSVGDIDLAVVTVPPKDKRLRFKLLDSQDLVLLVSQNHHLSNRTSVFLEELRDNRFICDNSRFNRKMLHTICQKAGFTPVIGYEIDDGNLIHDLIISTGAVALMPTPRYTRLRKDYPDSPVVIIQISDDIPPAIIGISSHRDFVPNNAAKLFISYLEEWVIKED